MVSRTTGCTVAEVYQVPAGQVEMHPLNACAALLEEGMPDGRP